MDVQKIVSAINKNFSEPFLPDGFVRAEARGENADELVLFIGKRDMHIDKDGKTKGAGTSFVSEYKVVKNDDTPPEFDPEKLPTDIPI